jgi:hypothetical protein
VLIFSIKSLTLGVNWDEGARNQKMTFVTIRHVFRPPREAVLGHRWVDCLALIVAQFVRRPEKLTFHSSRFNILIVNIYDRNRAAV